ncbi:MAG: type IV secretory system conjugative DNA transfer family protein [Moorellales bacterium]
MLFGLMLAASTLLNLTSTAAGVRGGSVPPFLLWCGAALAAACLVYVLAKQDSGWFPASVPLSLAAAAVLVHEFSPSVWRAFKPYIAEGLQAPADVPLCLGSIAAVTVAVVVGGAYRLARDNGAPLWPSLGPAAGGRSVALDVRVCPNVVVKHHDRYLHTMVVGTTGTGKTSRVLKPMIWQDLNAIKNGAAAGITVIEPKGDFAADVAAMARDLGLPVIFLNPEDPATPRFNPMEGPAGDVAEIMRTVLQSLFGKQEAFFRQAQEVTARNTVLLLKAIKGDDVTMLDLVEVLRDKAALAQAVELYEQIHGEATALSQFFRQELLGGAGQKMYEHTLGLRLQLEDITGNELLRRVLMGRSDISLDRHLAEGGVLVVNTAMGRLGKLGDLFGQFVMMHFQYAVFRRPGNERTRAPHVLYVDEFPRYVNPDFERLLAIGRSFRCATVLALQTTSQLLLEERPAFRDIVLENCRNKIVLNLGSAEDAKRFAAEFGENRVIKRARTYKRDAVIVFPYREDSIREDEKHEVRFTYTDLMELPKFTCVYRIVRDGQPLPPGRARLRLCEWDLRRRGTFFERLKRAKVQSSAVEGQDGERPNPVAGGASVTNPGPSAPVLPERQVPPPEAEPFI